jgi:hypothetical protein
MKQEQGKTYYTPELKKIGSVKELTQGNNVDPENDNFSAPRE